MEEKTRTENAIRNISVGIIGKMITLLLSFASRTVFIFFLGTELLGVNGLYSEILSVLSFTELGFGTALTVTMYKPAAEKDEKKLRQLICFYRRVYRIIAVVIAGLGVCLLPFLQNLVKGADHLSLHDLRVYFLIFLFNTVVSYFVSYKYNYVYVLQNEYISTAYNTVTSIVTAVIQIIVIVVSKNFLLYLLTNSAVLLASRFIIAWKLDKRFPILKGDVKESLQDSEKEEIYSEVKGLAVHRFADVAVHATDNIIISSIKKLGVTVVALVGNYSLIINGVLSFVTIALNAVTPGFGNLSATSDKMHYRKVFSVASYVTFWLYGFCSIAFFVLIPPFITLWIGEDKLIDTTSFLLILINCYLQGQCTIFNSARNAIGKFNTDKWWALIQAIVNLVVSVAAANQWGLVGVYIGTVASRMVYVVFRPYSTYKIMFGSSSKEYYIQLTNHFLITSFAGIVTWLSTRTILQHVTLLSFAVSAVIVLVVPNCIILLSTANASEQRELFTRIREIIKSRLRRANDE